MTKEFGLGKKRKGLQNIHLFKSALKKLKTKLHNFHRKHKYIDVGRYGTFGEKINTKNHQ